MDTHIKGDMIEAKLGFNIIFYADIDSYIIYEVISRADKKDRWKISGYTDDPTKEVENWVASGQESCNIAFKALKPDEVINDLF